MKSVNFNEKTYNIEDPTQFFIDLFSFRKENNSFFPTEHWELVLGAIVGGMGSGKSTLIRFLAAMGQKIYGSEFACYHTDDIVYLLKYLNKNPDKRKKVLFLFIDDALTKPGSDSRRSMSTDNVKASQNLSVVRHLLADENENGSPNPLFKNGFCAIFYAVQDPNRLDPFIRRNLHITLFKTHYDTLDKMLDPDNLSFIKTITEDGMYRHNYDARGYALGITKTGGCIKMYFPRTEFPIPIIYSEQSDYSDIVNHIMKFDLENLKDAILKGCIREYCAERKIKIDNNEIPLIIETARYRQWKALQSLFLQEERERELMERKKREEEEKERERLRKIVMEKENQRRQKLSSKTTGKPFLN